MLAICIDLCMMRFMGGYTPLMFCKNQVDTMRLNPRGKDA